MTNTQTSFTIYRDGEVDKDFIKVVRKRRAKAFETALQSHVEALGSRFLKQLGKSTLSVVTPIYLDYVDHKYGSNLRREYFDRKNQKAIDHIKSTIFTD